MPGARTLLERHRNRPSGATRLAAVIGDPVRHSRSPIIHNAAFEAAGLDWVYVALPVSDGDGAAAVDAMRTLGLDGLSVTMPHKQTVAAAVDRRTAAVDALGACNCVAREGDLLVGHNTDGAGFVASLRAETGLDLSGARVAVLGAGGAARAIIDSVGRAGASQIQVVNRTRESAVAAAQLAAVAEVAEPLQVAEADVVVNATAIGMEGGPDPEGVPIDPDILRASQVVVDIVYQPLRTPLMRAASDRGATVLGGLGMLVHQAAAQFELWTGTEAPVDVMLAAIASDLGD